MSRKTWKLIEVDCKCKTDLVSAHSGLYTVLEHFESRGESWSLPWRFKSYPESTPATQFIPAATTPVPRWIQFGMHNSASGEDEPRRVDHQEKEVPAGFQGAKGIPRPRSASGVTPFLPDARRLFPTTPCENKNSRDRPVRCARENEDRTRKGGTTKRHIEDAKKEWGGKDHQQTSRDFTNFSSRVSRPVVIS